RAPAAPVARQLQLRDIDSAARLPVLQAALAEVGVGTELPMVAVGVCLAPVALAVTAAGCDRQRQRNEDGTANSLHLPSIPRCHTPSFCVVPVAPPRKPSASAAAEAFEEAPAQLRIFAVRKFFGRVQPVDPFQIRAQFVAP